MGSTFLSHLPPFLTRLSLPRLWTSSLQYLPSSITHLFAYDLPLGSILPPRLTHLDFDSDSSVFNLHLYSDASQPRHGECLLPSSLTHLKLGQRFYQPLDHLPSSLTHLFLLSISKYEHPLNHLPLSLTHLVIRTELASPSIDDLPPSLKYLEIEKYYNEVSRLPPSLSTLAYGSLNPDIILQPPSIINLLPLLIQLLTSTIGIIDIHYVTSLIVL